MSVHLITQPFTTNTSLYIHPNTLSDALANIKSLKEKAKSEDNLDKKREIYDLIYTQFRSIAQNNQDKLPDIMKVPFFSFLETYAGSVCYAQANKITGDREEGFRKSARLMETSLILQLKEMRLSDCSINWIKQNSLESLVQEIGITKDTDGLLFDQISRINLDSQVLVQNIESVEFREVLEATLRRMTYSHQNISSLRDPAFHLKFNELTKAVIGSDTLEQKQRLADYNYNRCGFLMGLKDPSDWKAKMMAYSEVLKEFIACCPDPKDRLIRGKISQIHNMMALVATRSGMEGSLILAEPGFRKAYEIRKSLLEVANAEQRPNDEYLLANITTGIIHCLVTQMPISEQRLKEAIQLRTDLQTYLNACWAKGDVHSYQDSYTSAIKKVDDITQK